MCATFICVLVEITSMNIKNHILTLKKKNTIDENVKFYCQNSLEKGRIIFDHTCHLAIFIRKKKR